jgi:hypothetical protein
MTPEQREEPLSTEEEQDLRDRWQTWSRREPPEIGRLLATLDAARSRPATEGEDIETTIGAAMWEEQQARSGPASPTDGERDVSRERPVAYRLAAMLEEVALAGVEDPFDSRDRAALARCGYIPASSTEGLDVERLAEAIHVVTNRNRWQIAVTANGQWVGRPFAGEVAAEYARLASTRPSTEPETA